MKRSRNPYNNTAKRKRALAWMAARGITQPRALYPVAAHVLTITSVDSGKIAPGMRLVIGGRNAGRFV